MYTNLAQTIKFKLGRNTGLHVATDGVVLKHPTIKLVDLCPVVKPVVFFFVVSFFFLLFLPPSPSIHQSIYIQMGYIQLEYIPMGHICDLDIWWLKKVSSVLLLCRGRHPENIQKKCMFNYWHYYNCNLDTEIYALTLRERDWAHTGYLAKWLTL